MGARMRMRGKGERWRLAGSAAGIAAMCALAGCGSKIACDSTEAKTALTELTGLFDDFRDFVVEESTSQYAVCRANLVIANQKVPFRYRVDQTTEGKVVVFVLKDGLQ